MSPSPPPVIDTCAENRPRDDEQGDPRDIGLLRCGQRNAPVLGIPGADRDQILLLREPADGVHEQIAVALDAKRGIRGEIRVAEDDDSRLTLGGVLGWLWRVTWLPGFGHRSGESRSDRDWALLVAKRVV